MKKSVTSAPSKVKRSRKSWKEKLDPACLAYLEAHRETRQWQLPEGRILDVVEKLKAQEPRMAAASREWKRLPCKPKMRTVVLSADFVQLMNRNVYNADLLKPGKNRSPDGVAHVLETAQMLATYLEEPANRAQLYLSIGALRLVGGEVISALREREFGQNRLTQEQKLELAARCLEIIANLLRGRFLLRKGRGDSELIRILSIIEKYKIQPMSSSEVREAVLYAGLSVPEGETWRVKLHRARIRLESRNV